MDYRDEEGITGRRHGGSTGGNIIVVVIFVIEFVCLHLDFCRVHFD